MHNKVLRPQSHHRSPCSHCWHARCERRHSGQARGDRLRRHRSPNGSNSSRHGSRLSSRLSSRHSRRSSRHSGHSSRRCCSSNRQSRARYASLSLSRKPDRSPLWLAWPRPCIRPRRFTSGALHPSRRVTSSASLLREQSQQRRARPPPAMRARLCVDDAPLITQRHRTRESMGRCTCVGVPTRARRVVPQRAQAHCVT